ncbi:hypothetical protein ABZ353_10790 [Streptomyces niveus]|uniref:hypothetical protein n=1 Tax=Streptomyces niveus TaxID=193462 RepID=UPI0033DB2AD7
MIFLYLGLGAALTALEAFFAMVLIGAVHANVPEVPDFNYLGAVWLVLLVNVLVGGAVGSVRASGG